MTPVLYVVIPCFNEEAVIGETSARLLRKIDGMIKSGSIAENSRIVFVDDGSRDRTWELIAALADSDDHFGGLKLAHNRGHQNALLAGLMSVAGQCDAVVSMDADLQDDIEVLDQFVSKYMAGAEIVYGIRKNRDTDTVFKRKTAQAYYRFMDKLGTALVYDHADYRLLGSRALEALEEYREVNLFLRGIIPDLGFKTDAVYYERGQRFAGETKYPLKKMIALAVQGITSFSTKPLEMIFGTGVIITVVSLLSLIYALTALLCGWPLVLPFALGGAIFFMGGTLLICLGIVGVYVGKIYGEVKHRPRYLVEKKILKK